MPYDVIHAFVLKLPPLRLNRLQIAETYIYGQEHPLIEHHAICIGMDGWIQDVNAMGYLFTEKTGLRYPHANVHVLKDPTKREVLGNISSMNEVSFGPKDVLIVYYSGHGFLDKVKREFLFKTRKESLSRTEMVNAVEKVGAKNAVFIIDACRAGGFKASSDKMNVAVLPAKRSDELVYGKDESFTKLFIQRCKTMMRDYRPVNVLAIAITMKVNVSSDQWNTQLSIGPVDSVVEL